MSKLYSIKQTEPPPNLDKDSLRAGGWGVCHGRVGGVCGLGHGSVGADPLGQAELETHICCFQIGRKYYFALFKAVQAASGQSAAQPSSLALSGPGFEWAWVEAGKGAQ